MKEIHLIEEFLTANLGYVREKYSDKASLTVSAKTSANDLLTEVDLTVQKRFVDLVSDAFPGDLVVGEEGGYSRYPEDRNARCWVIDPIDGTNNFVRGLFPIFAISIAFTVRGEVSAAGVILPATGDLFLAESGSGSFRNGQRLHVSEVQAVNEACVHVDFCTPANRDELLARTGEVLRNAGQIRCHGSAVASICQIATGDVDGYVHLGLDPWDFAAAKLIVEEAAGRTSRLDGRLLRVFAPKSGLVITNGAIHSEVVRMLNR
jgi:myo-inositol-1(or 4)-monophosphatase